MYLSQIGEYIRTLKDGVPGAVSTIKHLYNEPGIYFASAKVATNRSGDEKDIFSQIKNLDRVRISVE